MCAKSIASGGRRVKSVICTGSSGTLIEYLQGETHRAAKALEREESGDPDLRSDVSSMKFSISRESLALVAICVVDTFLTVVLVGSGLASEANPLMARCLDQGFFFFCVVKLAAVALAVVAAESYRRRNPLFVRRALQMTITAYIGIYLTLFLAVNTV